MTLHVLLSGIVGSTAYGLADADSDVDRLGIYAAPTDQVLGLRVPKESIVQTNPDVTLHEIGKWCRLALAGNPTVMELVWLPEELYETVTPLGSDLITLRYSFLSATRVRKAYLGYATQQFRRLEQRGDGAFSSDLRRRTAKHARHLVRLLYQGLGLYSHGFLTVGLTPELVELCRSTGEQVAAGDLDAARRILADFERLFDAARTPLPDRPDTGLVDKWLRAARRQILIDNPDLPDVDQEGSDK